MPDLPARFAAPIISFAPLFVQRSWLHARVLLVGSLPKRQRRSVTAAVWYSKARPTFSDALAAVAGFWC